MARQKSAKGLAHDIRRHLRIHGSREHAAGVQWFFKEDVKSHGWYTAALRKYSGDLHRTMSGDTAYVLDVAEALFDSQVLEEKILAVLLVQRSLKSLKSLKPSVFPRLERWLNRVASWADHDALTMFVLGQLLITAPRRVSRVAAWAKSRHRWHRRAAAVTLIHGVSKGMFIPEATRIAHLLRRDADDMVQKGLGWLLRVWCKCRPDEAIQVVLAIKPDAARLVIRTACETLSAADKQRVRGAGL